MDSVDGTLTLPASPRPEQRRFPGHFLTAKYVSIIGWLRRAIASDPGETASIGGIKGA